MAKKKARRSGPTIPHFRRKGSATQLIVGGKPFLMIGGEIHNSSSSNLEYMEWVFDRVAALHSNTIIAPVFWELVEPKEGKFDWRLVDGLVRGARRRKLKLVPLWFGTWKNASSDYAPEWVKTDLERFVRAESQSGRRSNTISPVCTAGMKADAKAFAAFMRRIKAIDGKDHTVVAVQVQNETGLLGNSRDRSELAEAAFRSPIPAELVRRIESGKPFREEIQDPWKETGSRTHGTWSEVFGVVADEVFMAWHTARYVGAIAEAGKKEYSLPMFANAWLRWKGYETPGKYPSGGPVSRMHDIWRLAAPVLDCLAPDIYAPEFADVCADYARDGNPLLIPEARQEPDAPANALYCIGRHNAMCFAPFGIEDVDGDSILAKTYALLRAMSPLILEYAGTGQMSAVVRKKPITEEETEKIELGGYLLKAKFHVGREGDFPGGAIVIATGAGEYFVAGLNCRIDFTPKDLSQASADYLSIDEGTFKRGTWEPKRRLNGDERHVWFGSAPRILKARLYTY